MQGVSAMGWFGWRGIVLFEGMRIRKAAVATSEMKTSRFRIKKLYQPMIMRYRSSEEFHCFQSLNSHRILEKSSSGIFSSYFSLINTDTYWDEDC